MIMRNRPQILVVEDNMDDIELTKMALASQIIPSDLKILNEGEEAILYLLNPKTILPDLILLDLYLPKISGHEVLKKLRENIRTKDLPVIIFTSSKVEMDYLRSYEYGANACIRKGLEPNEFKAALRNLDVYWLIKSA